MKITVKDLILIRDFACKAMDELSTHSLYQKDNQQAQTYAFMSAAVLFLNSKKLLTEEVIVDQNMNPRYEKDKD